MRLLGKEEVSRGILIDFGIDVEVTPNRRGRKVRSKEVNKCPNNNSHIWSFERRVLKGEVVNKDLLP